MKKIVVVDDYRDFAEILREFIERQNDAECKVFSNPLDVLEHIKDGNTVDILISDYEMPHMNGFELATRVLEERPETRVTIMSGHNEETLRKFSEKYMIKDKIILKCKSDMEYLRHLTD